MSKQLFTIICEHKVLSQDTFAALEDNTPDYEKKQPHLSFKKLTEDEESDFLNCGSSTFDSISIDNI